MCSPFITWIYECKNQLPLWLCTHTKQQQTKKEKKREKVTSVKHPVCTSPWHKPFRIKSCPGAKLELSEPESRILDKWQGTAFGNSVTIELYVDAEVYIYNFLINKTTHTGYTCRCWGLRLSVFRSTRIHTDYTCRCWGLHSSVFWSTRIHRFQQWKCPDRTVVVEWVSKSNDLLQQLPTFSPPWILQLTPLMTRSRPGR